MKKWSQILLILCMLLGGLCVNGFAANSQKKSEFEPVLYRASQHGNLKKVQNLIKHGADVNEETEEGETPLHAAAEEGHLDIIRFLIENGANVNAVDHNGNTPLHSALDKNKTDDEDEEEVGHKDEEDEDEEEVGHKDDDDEDEEEVGHKDDDDEDEEEVGHKDDEDEDEEEIDRVKEIVPFHGDFSFPTKGWPCSSCREYSRSNQLHQRFVRKIPKNSQRIGGFQPIRGEW